MGVAGLLTAGAGVLFQPVEQHSYHESSQKGGHDGYERPEDECQREQAPVAGTCVEGVDVRRDCEAKCSKRNRH